MNSDKKKNRETPTNPETKQNTDNQHMIRPFFFFVDISKTQITIHPKEITAKTKDQQKEKKLIKKIL